VWHSLKYTSSLNEKLVYISEPVPEIHNHDVEVPARNSKSEPEQDPLDITIHNSPAILKEPLAPVTPITQTPFFTTTKSNLLQSITGTTMSATQTTTQTTITATMAIAPQHPLTAYELEELLNVAMGERGGGGPPTPGGGGPPEGGGPAPAATGTAPLQPITAAANVKAMGKDPPLFQGDRKKADTFINEVNKYLTLNDDIAGFNSPRKKVVLVLTFMQGPEVEEWTRGMLQWIQQIDDQSNTDNVWCIFL